jgi:tRNA-2-methylthio-N6-dimethylallyladenosine synthase
MRRRHTREEYLSMVARLRSAIPGLALSTDLIVGFPGETDAEFESTVSLVEAVRFHSIFSFKYSPRPNTLASKRMPDDVPEPEKSRRIVHLQARQKEIQENLLRELVGTDVEVLVDSVSRRRGHEMAGRTSTNVVVNLPGSASWVGKMAIVRVERAGPNSVWGRAVRVEGEDLQASSGEHALESASQGAGHAD